MTSRPEPASTSLQYQLDEITANTRALVPPERLARAESMVKELRDSGIEDARLPVGAQAPDFALTAASGKQVRSADLLALGPVILKFFRGRWDPYDMTELEAWESLQPALRHHRCILVGISPQTARQNAFTADRHRLTFPLLSDPAGAVATLFGLAYTVSPAHQDYFRSILVNIPFLNGDTSWRLPLPATTILNGEGTVIFSEAFADHRQRPEPAHVMAALESLVSRSSLQF
ncbi:MAG TPA: redoxin domain-containing protein [Acidobacteriaceae bacterium]|nr:redoxin domain-containing protein [Acidobacteriaceae bacterium]